MKLTKTELNIYEYCKENSAQITDMKIEELADATFTTSSTISKLVKKMGLTSYFEFKQFFKVQYTSTKEIYNMDSFSTAYINHIVNSLISIDFSRITNLASLFSHDRAIVLYGVGSSGYACKYFADNLIRLGYNCIYDVEYFSCARRAKLFSDPLIICITNSGDTSNIMAFTEELGYDNNINYITSNRRFTSNQNSIIYTENAISNSMFSNQALLSQISILDHLLHELSKKQEVTTKFNSIYK